MSFISDWRTPMKRDMDLIRELLLRFEDAPGEYVGRKVFAINGRTANEIDAHLALLEGAGHVEHPDPIQMFPNGVSIERGRRLTNSGHDFLDAVRDPEIWAKTKSGAVAVGGFTIDLLKDLAVGFLKKKVEDMTGVQL